MTEKKPYNSKVKVILTLAVASMVVLTFALLGATLSSSGKPVESALVFIIALTILLLAVLRVRGLLRDRRQGLPHEDERSIRIKERAGFYTMMVVLWYSIALAWFVDSAEEAGWTILTRHALESLVIVIAVSFLGFWWILGKRGEGA